MNSQLTILPQQTNFYPIIQLVTDSLTSPNSKRAYTKRLTDFLTWYDDTGRPGMTKATVNQYRAALLDQDKSASSVNLALPCAIRYSQAGNGSG